MNKKNTEIGSWIIPLVLFFIVPEVGTFFIVIKVVSTVIKGLKKAESNNNSPFNQAREQNEIKPHNINFSHDHGNYGNNRNKTKTSSFDTEINVRCPICSASNFTNKLPTTCEYCGSQITKK